MVALRFNQWKIVYSEQRAKGLAVWMEPFVPLRMPKLFNLRADPFERADEEAEPYAIWTVQRLFVMVPAQAFVAKWLETFKQFPPRQTPASWSIDDVMKKMEDQEQYRKAA
jgi:arylsulfatase